MKMKNKKYLTKSSFLMFYLLASLVMTGSVYAQSSSNSYRVEEYYFGTGGEVDASSPNYRSRQSSGQLGVGNSGSSNYQINAGFNTPDQPFLEFSVTGGVLDLSILNAGITTTGTANFSVRSYLSQGYVVTVLGTPPTSQGGAEIDAMSSPSDPATSQEQFGMNLVANTLPTNFGANALQAPDSSFSFGFAASGYDTPNKFKYASGDVIAKSLKSSGRTDYTVSYIVNISPLTPAGAYSAEQVFVATATF